MADSKASKLRPPSKIGRPCCTVPPKPALPPSPPRPTMNSMEPLWESQGHRLSEAGLRRGSDTSVVLTEDTDSFIIGDRVWVGGTKPGSIAYIGETQFAPGDWAGVVLDEAIGKNDGSVAGSRYFQCEPKRGIFSRLTRLTRQPLPEAMIMSPTGEKTPTSPPDSTRGNLAKSMSPSLNASTTSLASVSHKDLKLGDRVIVSSSQGSKTGVLRFFGTTEFAAGEWCGVELDDAVGKNDGSVGEIRYFECRPKHGLFAPLHKVSRSPTSRRTSTMCSVHKPTGASMNSSIRRIGGSRESLASMSSIASTNASVATRGTTSGSRRPGLHTSTPARSSMQEILKEKQHEIEMLRKERDFERQRISKAATQADNAEQTVLILRQEYQEYREDMEKTVREAQAALAQLLDEKNTLKVHLEEERQKSEDLLFRFEEESVNKDDIQNRSTDQCVVNTLNESKLKELEQQLSEERERVIQLEQENTKLFEAEEEIAKLRTELSSAFNHQRKDFQDIENRNLCLEEAKITLEKQMLERNDRIEQYASQIQDFETRLKERDQESRAALENNLQRSTDEIKKSLAEKCAIIEKMKGEHEIDSETLKKEIEQLKQMIENIIKDSTKEKEAMAEEHRRIVNEKENTIKLQSEQLKAESNRNSQSHKTALEKLRADSVDQINQLSDNFKKQLADKDLQISNGSQQLEVKSAELERLAMELSLQRSACLSKDDELEKLLKRLEELSVQLKTSEELNGELMKRMDSLRVQSEKSYTSIVDEKQKLEQSMASLLASSADSSAQLEKLNEDLRKKEKELSELRDAKAAEIEELKKNFEIQIEDKTKYITEIDADISLKSLRLSALEGEIAELKSIIANKDEEIKNLLEKKSELQDAITLSEQTKTNLESEVRMYDLKISELNQKLLRTEEKSTQLAEQKMKLEAEIANVISTSTSSTDQLLKYNEDLRRKEKELDQLRDHSFHVENSLAEAESKIQRILEELTKSKALADEYLSASNVFKDKITAESKTTGELTSEVAQLKTREQTLLERLKEKEKLDAELKEKHVEILELTDKLEKVNEEYSVLNEKTSVLEKDALDKEKWLESVNMDLRNGMACLRDESTKSQETSVKLSSECANLKKSVELAMKNIAIEIEEKKKLESLVADKNSHVERLEEKIAQVQKERDEAAATANLASTKYNESLMQLALLNSTQASTEAEKSLELSNLKEQLVRAESSNKELADRLKINENSAHESKAKIEELAQILKTLERENSELSNHLKKEEISVQKFQNLLDNHQKEANEKLEKREKDNSELNKQIELLKTRVGEMQSELRAKNTSIQEREATAESLKKQLEEAAASNKAKETEAKSVATLIDRAQAENEKLQENIVTLKSELSSKELLVDEMRKEVDSLREIPTNMLEDAQRSITAKLEAKQAEIDQLDKRYESLCLDKELGEKNFKTQQERIESLSDLLQEREKSSAENLRHLKEELELTKAEAAHLKENQNRLEKENKQIAGKLAQTLEDLNTFNGNKKNMVEIETYPSNLKIESAGGDSNQNSDRQSELEKLANDNETYRGQIDFLNSVIVDMQRKNETLVCKIEVLEMGVPSNEADDYTRSTLDKRMAAPRMFCDICDQFDLHETEDCPCQAQDFVEPEKPKKSPKKPPVDRPYCENCEMFGHDRLNCDDAETF